MKKFVVLLAVLAVCSPALAAYNSNNTETLSQAVVANGGTVTASSASWTMSPYPAPLTSASGPYSGATGLLVPMTTGTTDIWYKCSLQANGYATTVNLDQNIGTGVSTYYANSAGTGGVTTPDSLGKILGKNGTYNVTASIYADKMQWGTQSRTSTTTLNGQMVTSKATLAIGTGGAVRIGGTEASGNAGNNFALAYGAKMDTFVKVSGTGVLSGLTRVDNAVVGGRTLEFGRSGSSYSNNVIDFEVSGSQATVEAWSLKMNGNATTASTLRFITDAGGSSSINLHGNGGAVLFGANTKLDFLLGAAPLIGQTFTVLNLIDGTATMNTTAGKFKTLWGTTVNEGDLIDVWYDGTMYGLHASYKGGTGNDFTLTAVPEPATLALLSLGGLVLARRRRA